MATQLFTAASTDVTTSAFDLTDDAHRSAFLITIYGRGDFDGAHVKPRISPEASSGNWQVITSAVLSADGFANVWVSHGFYLDAIISAASTSTSVDLWMGKGFHNS